MNLKVKIIIINYKGWKDTIECLESVLKSDYKEINIFVVDNSPDDVSIKKLEDWAIGNIYVENTNFEDYIIPYVSKPIKYNITTEKKLDEDFIKNQQILFIKSDNNGFAAANNIVLRKLYHNHEDCYIFLLNNDTVIRKDSIANFVSAYEKESNIGIAGGILLEYHNRGKVQTLGGRYNKIFGITKQVYEGGDIKGLPLNPKLQIDYPSGAAMFLSSDVLRKVGLLSEEYFLFFEEIDWIKRPQYSYVTDYLDNCFVYHKGSSSIGANSKSYISEKYSLLNRIKFAKKYNRKFLTTVYVGVLLTIMKRFFSLRINLGFKLLKDLVNNEN